MNIEQRITHVELTNNAIELAERVIELTAEYDKGAKDMNPDTGLAVYIEQLKEELNKLVGLIKEVESND